MATINDYLGFRKSILPLERMQDVSAQTDTYRTAEPFPHIVVDDFFDPLILDRVLDEFPGEAEIDWRRFNDPRSEIKLASQSERQLGLFTRYVLYSLNSSAFVEFLEQLTGIQGLIPDPHLWGGGLHQILPGGKLGVHADFNRYERVRLDRRLNVLIYLNRDWKEEWGGHLELWNRDMKTCVRRVLPLFNRMVCFSTTDYSFHGHPDPLRCPQGRARRSLALYYYSNGQPEEKAGDFRDTNFQQRPGEAPDWRQLMSLRGLLRKLTPPLVTELRQALRRRR